MDIPPDGPQMTRQELVKSTLNVVLLSSLKVSRNLSAYLKVACPLDSNVMCGPLNTHPIQAGLWCKYSPQAQSINGLPLQYFTA